MLKGSASEKVQRAGLSKLSTFGILPNFTQPEISRILDALVEAKLLECPEVERYRPVVQLTERGWDYLKAPDEKPLTLRLSDDLRAKIQGRAGQSPRRRKNGSARYRTPLSGRDREAEPDPLPRPGSATSALPGAREAKQPAYCVFQLTRTLRGTASVIAPNRRTPWPPSSGLQRLRGRSIGATCRGHSGRIAGVSRARLERGGSPEAVRRSARIAVCHGFRRARGTPIEPTPRTGDPDRGMDPQAAGAGFWNRRSRLDPRA